jgi:hypothetical protein
MFGDIKRRRVVATQRWALKKPGSQPSSMETEKKRSIVFSFITDGGPAGSGGTRLCSWWGGEMDPREQWLENATASSGRAFYRVLDSDLASWAVEAGERGKGNDDFEGIVQSS